MAVTKAKMPTRQSNRIRQPSARAKAALLTLTLTPPSSPEIPPNHSPQKAQSPRNGGTLQEGSTQKDSLQTLPPLPTPEGDSHNISLVLPIFNSNPSLSPTNGNNSPIISGSSIEKPAQLRSNKSSSSALSTLSSLSSSSSSSSSSKVQNQNHRRPRQKQQQQPQPPQNLDMRPGPAIQARVPEWGGKPVILLAKEKTKGGMLTRKELRDDLKAMGIEM